MFYRDSEVTMEKKKTSDSRWEAIIAEVDQNNDGKLTFDEFEKAIENFLDSIKGSGANNYDD